MGRNPIWTSIAEELRGEIIAGVYPPGARLPTEAALSSRFRVHRHTVRRALAGLAQESLVLSRQGAGVFVVPPPVDIAVTRGARRPLDLSEGETGERQILALDTRFATPMERRGMRLDTGARVHVLEALILSDGLPVGVMCCHFPAEQLPGLGSALRARKTVAEALASCGVKRSWRCSVRLTAQIADDCLAERLRLEEGAALLRLDTLDVDAQGRAVEMRRTWFSGDRVTLTLARE